DMVVFPPISGNAYGHIAAVDRVDSGGLWVMDDNWNLDQRKSCAWGGNVGWVHNGTWTPYGFYRLKSLEPAASGPSDAMTGFGPVDFDGDGRSDLLWVQAADDRSYVQL